MPRLIEIGHGPSGPVTLDIDLMLRQGLYVQANSGGGKSWLLRRLAEQLCAYVPTFVVDVEGEFASLRERFPFFLVAREGGDALADPRTAGAIARKLLELRVSAVFDIFGLDIPDRHAWVKAFLEAMDQAPRPMWGDTAVLIDEAHVFAPERGKGESSALNGMAALATRGRKRGFGPVDATQRGPKFNKDVQSELKNAIIGLATWEIDRERAREALGVPKSERVLYDKALRSLDAGEFFVTGRAFGTFDPLKVKVGAVESTHPEPGQVKHAAAPPPPAKIRAILAKLGDLPKEVEKEVEGEKALRAEIERLRAELAGANAGGAAEERDRLRTEVTDLRSQMSLSQREIGRLRDDAKDFDLVLGALERAGEEYTGRPMTWAPSARQRVQIDRDLAEGRIDQVPAPPPVVPAPAPRTFFLNDAHELPRERVENDGDGASRILRALKSSSPRPLTRAQVGVLAVIKPSGGSFGTYISRLAVKGHITRDGGLIGITPAGAAASKSIQPSSYELVKEWGEKLGGKTREILVLMTDNQERTKAQIANEVGVEVNGGSFGTYISRLRANGLIEKTQRGFTVVSFLRLR